MNEGNQRRRATYTHRSNDAGSGSVLAIVGMLIALGVALVGLAAGQFATARAVAASAADLSALAAIDGALQFDQCDIAGQIAQRNRAQLQACRAIGADIEVEVSVQVGGWVQAVAGGHAPTVTSIARAGLPASDSDRSSPAVAAAQ